MEGMSDRTQCCLIGILSGQCAKECTRTVLGLGMCYDCKRICIQALALSEKTPARGYSGERMLDVSDYLENCPEMVAEALDLIWDYDKGRADRIAAYGGATWGSYSEINEVNEGLAEERVPVKVSVETRVLVSKKKAFVFCALVIALYLRDIEILRGMIG